MTHCYQTLQDLRNTLLLLHKTLIESEKVSYETVFGPIPSANHFLKLLAGDRWFIWLQPLSQLIVSLDESLDDKELLTPGMAKALIQRSQLLLVASEGCLNFSGNYYEALQRDPEVIFAHAQAIRLFRSLSTLAPNPPSPVSGGKDQLN